MGARPHLLIAGIPVRIEPSFLLIVALLGLGPDIPLNLTLAWVGAAIVSVLVHELGHAFAFRRYGVESAITLRGLGGVTTPGRALRGRSQVIVTSLAGPLTTLILFGIPSIWLFESDWAGSDFDREVLVVMLLIINVGWSLLNLLPILPLDGGHVVEQVIGSRPAHLLSVVVALPLAAVAFTYDQPFAAILALLFAVQNGAALSTRDGAGAVGGFLLHPPRPTPTPPVPAPEPTMLVQPAPTVSGAAAEQLAWSLLGSGDAPAARALAARAGPSASSWLEGALALHDGAFVTALATFEQALLERRPFPSPYTVSLAAQLVATHLPVRLTQRLLARRGEEGVAGALHLHALLADNGQPRAAAQVAELLMADDRVGRARAAYEAARDWAAVGDAERSLRRLEDAVAAGWTDGATLLDADPLFASVRALPDWPALRARHGNPAPADAPTIARRSTPLRARPGDGAR